MPKAEKPLLGINMGDTAGIGPEIIVKAYSKAPLIEESRTLVIGSAYCLKLARHQFGVSVPISVVAEPEDVPEQSGGIVVIEPVELLASKIAQGTSSALCGQAAVQYFEAAVNWCLAGRLSGVVTCPINRKPFRWLDIMRILVIRRYWLE